MKRVLIIAWVFGKNLFRSILDEVIYIYIQDPTGLVDPFQTLIYENETMHFNSEHIPWVLKTWVFIYQFGKSVVLILHYLLTFLESSRFSDMDKFDWGAAGSREFIQYSCSLKPISELKYAHALGLFVKYWSAIENVAAWLWWILFWGISEHSRYACFVPVQFILPGNRPI